MLSLSTKGRYATRIITRLALFDNNTRPARKKEIADAEAVSEDYTEQILVRLKAAGLVASHRGTKGGFSLARTPEKITVTDVLNAMDGPLHIVPCMTEPCERATECITRDLWHAAERALLTVFSGTTVADLANRARMKTPSPLNYNI